MTTTSTGPPIATALLVITLALWALLELRQALNRRAGATNTDRGSLMVVRLAAIAGAGLAALATRVEATSYAYSPVVMGIALVVVWAGVGLRLWAFRALGRYFTFQVMTSADQPVVTTGPYRVLRHPSYTGILLILLGIGLTYRNWLSLAALTIVPLFGFINRIHVEEAALASALGDRYVSFARGRKRLVPFVW